MMTFPRRDALLLALAIAVASPCRVHADGGVVRLSERRGGFRVTAFTSPNPVRAGPIDVSVLVQNAVSGEVVPNATVHVTATRQGEPARRIDQVASTGAATNKLLQAALFELPEPGRWEISVTVDGAPGRVECRFEIEVAEPLPRWASLGPWIAWPALVVLAFGVHQWRVRKRWHGHAKAGASVSIA